MITSPDEIKELFRGSFISTPVAMKERLFKVKAYVFDWDGVFNNGTKDASGSSPFNEVDSMGLNMLRFHHYRQHGHNPVTAIITGETNEAAFKLANREHIHAVYSGIKNKTEALKHFCDTHVLQPSEVAYFFDDVLDLSISGIASIRMMMGREGSPLFTELVKENQLADYITASGGGQNGLREACELVMGLSGGYSDTIMERVRFSDSYKQYIAMRNEPTPVFYSVVGTAITKQQTT